MNRRVLTNSQAYPCSSKDPDIYLLAYCCDAHLRQQCVLDVCRMYLLHEIQVSVTVTSDNLETL